MLLLFSIDQNMLNLCIPVHSKKCWVVLNQIWVEYGQTQPLGETVCLKM